MLGICRKARLPCVRPADLLEPGWEIGVFQVGMVAAVTTDQLERAGVAAHALMRDPDRLPPQGCRPTVAGLARPGRYHNTVRVNARRRVTGMTIFTRCRDEVQTNRRPSTGHDARVFSTTHATPPQASGFAPLPGSGAALSSTSMLSTVTEQRQFSRGLRGLPANCLPLPRPCLAPGTVSRPMPRAPNGREVRAPGWAICADRDSTAVRATRGDSEAAQAPSLPAHALR